MKLADILKVVANELGTSDLKEINKLLKEPSIKFRITGKALGHFGFTGHIKSLSEVGVKVYLTNKVSLVRLGDIESFEKAKPRAERPVRTAKAEAAAPAKAGAKKTRAPLKAVQDDDDDEDDDFDDDEDFAEEDLLPKKLKKKKKLAGKGGSKFIPSGKR